jgi:putative ABC transport system permease protein
MSTPRLLMSSVRAMRRWKLRTGFMMLGSLVGVAALTLVVSIGQGAREKVLRNVSQILGDSGVLILGGGTRLMGSPRADLGRLTADDIAAVSREVSGIQAWDAEQDLSMPVKYRDASTTVRVLGGSERSEQVWGRSASEGRYFDASDVAGSARVAVIGRTAARALFGDQSPLDAEIRVASVPFRVIGVLEPFGIDLHGMDRDNEIAVPLSTLARRLTNTDGIAMAKVLIRDPERAEETGREIRRILRDRHALAAAQPEDFKVITPEEVRRNIALMERIFFLYVPMVAGVVLAVGGIVSAALMLSSVNARVGEIGLRRAVGARPEDIRLQFLAETAVTTITGGIAGILIGYIGAGIVAARLQLGGIFSWRAVLLGLAASAVTGVLAGVVPARRAAGLQPAEALR